MVHLEVEFGRIWEDCHPLIFFLLLYVYLVFPKTLFNFIEIHQQSLKYTQNPLFSSGVRPLPHLIIAFIVYILTVNVDTLTGNI